MLTSSSNNWLLSLKIVLISTGVVSMAVALKLSVPVAADLVSSQLPSLLSWLRPPYLYILINCIIISIVASSKLHTPKSAAEDRHHGSDIILPTPETVVPPGKISQAHVTPDYLADNGVVLSEFGYDSNVPIMPKVSDSYAAELSLVNVIKAEPEEKNNEVEVTNGGDEVVSAATAVSRPVRSGLQRKNSMEFWLNENQKPPVSARFVHRKSVKSSPEGGKSLGVSKPYKRQDTLESTWKMITDGRSVPLTRHMKKSDTWERADHRRMDENTPPTKTMNKSETFQQDRNRRSSSDKNSPAASGSGSDSGRLRKEASLSQDELNRRVEAFINKFNEEMRLQRQESLNQYQEMIARGAHPAPLAQ